jgi:hypothetical protein
MTDNVVNLDVVTCIDVPVDRVIDGAKEAGLDVAVVVGYHKNGDLYFASSLTDGGDVLWLLEIAKKQLLELD